MAKIRVYEFAKDLNMTNKELLKKIEDLDIEVSSHMSSLDDESVKKIKSSLFGSLNEDKVDEKRVRPTVIRRRKKIKNLEEVEYNNVLFNKKASGENLEQKSLDKEHNAEISSDCLIRNKEDSEKNNFENCKLDQEGGVIGSIRKKKVQFSFDNSRKISQSSSVLNLDKSKECDMNITDHSLDTVVQSDERLLKSKKKVKKEEITLKKLETDKNKKSAEVFSSGKNNSDVHQKNILENENVRMFNNNDDNKTDERHKKTKKNKAWKSIHSKSIKKKEVPAKIIKKAVVVKPVPSVDSKESSPVVSKYNNNNNKVDKYSANEPANRKVFRKKIVKKKEVIEGSTPTPHVNKRKFIKNRRRFKSKVFSSGQKTQITVAKAIKRRVKIDETIVLSNLAKRLGVKANEMIGKLMNLGVMVTVNQTIDYDTACLVANEFNYEVERASFEEDIILRKERKDDPSKMVQRPPVVTIMGHVDHGKTSLLDVIRKTRVTEREAGGITQHIGAYSVKTHKGLVAFLDTPGHEAFSAMRSRGAKVTDLVVLVVAADDGVMPQTVEAINHSKASKVPIIIAINKIDKIGSDPERVLRELSEYGLITEGWGGDVISVEVSAKENTGIDTLLEMILLQAEILEFRANPDKLARGHVVESRLDSGRGPMATVLVQEGTLRSGDSVICGMHYGKIRALHDDIGQKVEYAGPSMPVEIIGLSGVPMAGDELIALEDEKDAKQVSLHRIQKQRAKELAKTNRLSLEGLFERMQKGEIKDLNLIIKADVDGSIEALKDSLIKLSNDEVNIGIVHSATGTITESDVSLAAVSNAVIIGFNVRPNAKVQDCASEENVDIRFYDVIYNVIKDIKGAIVGLMDSTYEEKFLGRASVRQVFHVPKIGSISGCYVTDGKILRGKSMRLLRDGVVVYQGKNSSLRRFKDDVKEVQGGYECGIGIEKFNDIKVGDVIECYYMEEIKPNID